MIRWMDRKDLAAIEEMYRAQGFDYELPRIFATEGFEARRGEANPARNTVVRMVAADESGRARLAILGRRVLEAYFLIDHRWGTPGERYEQFLELHNAACASARSIGYEEAIAMLPPEIERAFAKRIAGLGWGANVWRTYSRAL